ncbi:MAG: hypothetical protein U1E27_06735, partial [Kiritimatiellia bacterium]|nr:hypothetical protein [Kiritimatiellia bacterium]
MIPTAANQGYERIGHTPVEEVNGKPIRSIRDLHLALQEPLNGLQAIRLRGNDPILYLDDALSKAVNQRLLASGISSLFRVD